MKPVGVKEAFFSLCETITNIKSGAFSLKSPQEVAEPRPYPAPSTHTHEHKHRVSSPPLAHTVSCHGDPGARDPASAAGRRGLRRVSARVRGATPSPATRSGEEVATGTYGSRSGALPAHSHRGDQHGAAAGGRQEAHRAG